MILREMLVDDLDQVMEIEEELFSVPWTKEGFLTFLMKENGMFLVVEEKGRILGYCGLLTVLDEGDVTNVAVRRERQREGIGNFLMRLRSGFMNVRDLCGMACERGTIQIPQRMLFL